MDARYCETDTLPVGPECPLPIIKHADYGLKLGQDDRGYVYLISVWPESDHGRIEVVYHPDRIWKAFQDLEVWVQASAESDELHGIATWPGMNW